MKYFYAFLFSFTFLQNNFAQTNVYQPYPSDSVLWLYVYQTNIQGPTYTVIQWLGDTIINSKSYKKIFKGTNANPYTANNNLQYAGGVRQDIPNEKIYQIDLTGTEKDISISRNLIVGDTFSTNTCPW